MQMKYNAFLAAFGLTISSTSLADIADPYPSRSLAQSTSGTSQATLLAYWDEPRPHYYGYYKPWWDWEYDPWRDWDHRRDWDDRHHHHPSPPPPPYYHREHHPPPPPHHTPWWDDSPSWRDDDRPHHPGPNPRW